MYTTDGIVPLEVSGYSSYKSENHQPKFALTEISHIDTGFWHSDDGDKKPWISFKMPISRMVWKVEVTDRVDVTASHVVNRFNQVEVSVGLSPEKQNSRQSCGVKSYAGSFTYT